MFATITSNHKPVRNLPICRRSISLQYKRREESTPAFWGRFRHFSWCRQTRIGSKTAAIVAISKPYSLGFIQLWPVFTLKAQKTTFIQADSRQRLFFLWRTREDSNLWPLESESNALSSWATGTYSFFCSNRGGRSLPLRTLNCGCKRAGESRSTADFHQHGR